MKQTQVVVYHGRLVVFEYDAQGQQWQAWAPEGLNTHVCIAERGDILNCVADVVAYFTEVRDV